MSEKKKLDAGDKYLSIKLNGHDYVVAFKNKDRNSESQPHFKGDGVAVWVRTKKDECDTIIPEEELI